MFTEIKENRFGFYQLVDIPTTEEIEEYYAQKYYQEAAGGYEISYSHEEIKYINNKLEQKYQYITEFFQYHLPTNPKFLDIGCGEGWALKFFENKSWDILGLDYSEFGCRRHNPEYLRYMITGDIYKNIDALIATGKKYNCIWLDNVLEHVVNPLELLTQIRMLIENNGIMVVEVPNDFSAVQKYLFAKNYITKPFWVVRPDHISYFNQEGLLSISRAAGWECLIAMGDYPIDFNLFNVNTNYAEDKSKGKVSHQARITIENFLHDISPAKTNELYKILGSMGLGRQIIGFFRLGDKYE